MTRDDGPQHPATTARHKPAKRKRTKAVGRTGARFPSANLLDTDEGTGERTREPADAAESTAESTAAPTSAARAPAHPDERRRDQGVAHLATGQPTGPSTHPVAARETLPGAPAPHPSASSDPAATSDPPSASSSSSDVEPVAPAAGGTGARFGPYSVRKPKRANDSSSGGGPAHVEQPPIEQSPVEVPPGEPTPERSAERTVQLVKPWAGALVRPYAHTGGRTRARHDLALETLISSRGRTSAGAGALTTHHRRMIVDLCTRPRSVAEVAALLSVPLGVARVLLGDLAAAGAVVVHPTAGNTDGGEPDVAFMRRVLVGLRRL